MAGDPVIKLRALRIRQQCGVRFQAFPDRIEQFCLLRGGQAFYLASQVAHIPLTLARFALSGKRYLHEPAVLFFLRVEQAEQHFLDAGRAGGLELLLDSGLQGWVADFDRHDCLLRFKGTGKGGVNQQNPREVGVLRGAPLVYFLFEPPLRFPRGGI